MSSGAIATRSPDGESGDARAEFADHARNLVSENQWRASNPVGARTLDDRDIGVAQTRIGDLDDGPLVGRNWVTDVHQLERSVWCSEKLTTRYFLGLP